ncbi:MAG TPA: hypothetical protein VHL09_02950, partial [Dehalococcoidia bacterium]|nr:hypothetical protein [Dehalococcoidia bacterium]
ENSIPDEDFDRLDQALEIAYKTVQDATAPLVSPAGAMSRDNVTPEEGGRWQAPTVRPRRN